MPKPKFQKDDKIKCLLWCDRHCCICKKNCGADIEVAHIDRKLKREEINTMDNAIPLCYDCHAKIGHYNLEEPRGNKYQPEELKKRREQVYEEFTRYLVPQIDIQITQRLLNGAIRKFPDVGVQIKNLGKGLPVKIIFSVNIYHEDKIIHTPSDEHYKKQKSWKMNPGMTVQGHFEIPTTTLEGIARISAKVENIEIIDEYERPHSLFPMEWVYELRNGGFWWYNP